MRGFTLLELMIAVVVAAMLLTLGAPSIKAFLDHTALTSQSNNWVGVLNHARTEAIARSQRVTVCRTQNPGTCLGDANCDCGVTEAAGSPPNYHTGYLIFTSGTNAQPINFRPGQGNVLLRKGQADSDKLTIRGNGFADNAFSFMSNGRLDLNDVSSAGLTARHVVCVTDSSGDLTAAGNSSSTEGRAVVISETGRPRVATLAASDCSGDEADGLAQ